MSRVDLHPEELFDRARRGEASPREAERFQAHLERCRACRFEYTLALECVEGAAPLPGDDLVLLRIRRAISRDVEKCAAARSKPASRPSVGPVRALLVAASVVVSLVIAGQGARLARRAWRFAFPASSLSMASLSAAGNTRAAEPAITLATHSMQELPFFPAGNGAVGSSAQGTPWDVVVTPEELFARANTAQRDGRTGEAVQLYNELQTAFPGSSDELVSRVMLGRLLLHRIDDARGALVQFDSYLANPEHDVLREEALIGRALALERLYRHAEEKRAWEALLVEYPQSAHAGPARTRLDELR